MKKLENPFSDEFYTKWDKRANKNTLLYRKIFRCYPDDNILTLPDVKTFMEKAKLEKYDKRKIHKNGFVCGCGLGCVVGSTLIHDK